MPGESILVVDDAPVNLKLADLVLRKEGFQVFAVPDAEEALRLLRTVCPDLILVDIQLPGMDGLELTRRIKQEPRTCDIRVVALTACAMKGDKERALEAGCDGYITKPINTQTFGRCIREFLAAKAVPPAAPAPLPAPTADTPETDPQPVLLPTGLELSGIELESLRRRFLEEGILQSRQLLLDLGSKFDIENARSLVHRWVGGAGALEYSAIAALSRGVSELLEARHPDLRRLREILTELTLAFSDPREATLDELPPSLVKKLAGKRVAMVAFASDEAERLCSTLQSLGALPRLFEADEWPESQAIRHCHAVMVHIRDEAARGPWLDEHAPFPAGRSVVFVGSRDRIMALPPVVQDRAQEFLIDGWQPEEAVMRLVFALSRSHALHAVPRHECVCGAPPASPRPPAQRDNAVLIADDDLAVRTVMQGVFRNHQIPFQSAVSGDEAWRIIRESRPTAAVLDVNMPVMNGFEVLSAIRAAALPVRVILLTARTQEKDIVQGFHLGADDYVIKPFNPVEVVVRLKRLLARS